MGLNKKNIAGILTEVGGKTSHSTILARALELPAVLSVPKVLDLIEDGDGLIVDDSEGRAYHLYANIGSVAEAETRPSNTWAWTRRITPSRATGPSVTAWTNRSCTRSSCGPCSGPGRRRKTSRSCFPW